MKRYLLTTILVVTPGIAVAQSVTVLPSPATPSIYGPGTGLTPVDPSQCSAPTFVTIAGCWDAVCNAETERDELEKARVRLCKRLGKSKGRKLADCAGVWAEKKAKR